MTESWGDIMTNIKEKLTIFIGSGLAMGVFGIIKNLTKSISHDIRFITKIESMNLKRPTRDLQYIDRSLNRGIDPFSDLNMLNSTVVRTATRSLPKWEEISGGVEPLSVTQLNMLGTDPARQSPPLYVDLRLWDNPITSQGNEGSCTAYATISAMENLLNQTYKAKIKLSEKSLWSIYKKPKITSAIESAKGEGNNFVQLYSFNGMYIKNEDWIAYINNQKPPISIRNTKEILELVAANYPVILTAEVNESFDRGSKGWIDVFSPKTGTAHAFTVVGYKITPLTPRSNYFIIRNSWGTDWGDQGYGYLPMEYCRKFSCEGFVIKNVRLEKRENRSRNISSKYDGKLTTVKKEP
jgi:C1A family cysteine protease